MNINTIHRCLLLAEFHRPKAVSNNYPDKLMLSITIETFYYSRRMREQRRCDYRAANGDRRRTDTSANVHKPDLT